jgi:6-phosphogluconolactonase
MGCCHKDVGKRTVAEYLEHEMNLTGLRSARGFWLLAAFAGFHLLQEVGIPAYAAQRASAESASGSDRVALYASIGPELTHYSVDVKGTSLIRRDAVTLPANVQYVWPHPSRKYLYVAWSVGLRGDRHGVSVFQIDPASGALHPHGASAPLASRPIHLTTDIPGSHVLVAHNNPPALTVFQIRPDGTIGSQVGPPAALDVGVYPHQVRVDPSNKLVFLVARGNGPTPGKAEDPGAVKVFRYADGSVTNRASIAPSGGFDFQPRHLDFHPSRPWVFVSLERQNKLQVFEKVANDTLSPAPLFSKNTLTDPAIVHAGQIAGTVHVHPGGRFVYVANRASDTEDVEGKRVFIGGENSIAVFAIDQRTGEPTKIQNIDTRGLHPRTFAIDPSGRMLVAANLTPLLVRDGKTVTNVPASLTIYRIGDDGRLGFAHKYDVDAAEGQSLFWMGLVPLP